MSSQTTPGTPDERGSEAEVVRLRKIVNALMDRAERSTNGQGSDFSLFQTTVMLEEEVRRRTTQLEAALREIETINRALRESEAKFRGLVSQSLAGIAILENGGFSYANPRFAEMLGCAAEEVPELGPLDIATDDHRQLVAEQVRRCLSGEADHAEYTFRGRRRDGGAIDIECHSSVMDAGEKRALISLLLDITERKKLELNLQHAQELEAVGGLAVGIAHEINTPIQFVGDNLRFLQDAFRSLQDLLAKYEDLRMAAGAGGIDGGLLAEVSRAAEETDIEYLTEELPKALAQSLDGVERVATIVKAMKEFAHPEQKEKQAADLNQALSSTLVVAGNELRCVADVETDFGDLPPVECHVGDLNQVFLNLLINAAHAIGAVVNGTGTKGTIRVRTWREGGWVRIAVADTGCGIAEAIRDKVFQPFFTTKGVGRGTGQGLAISRSIVVDKHGGTLTFQSEVGRGSTFMIGLPVSGLAEYDAAGPVLPHSLPCPAYTAGEEKPR